MQVVSIVCLGSASSCEWKSDKGVVQTKPVVAWAPQKTATELLHLKFPQYLCRVNIEN